MNFVQHRHGQNAADSGDALQTEKRVGVIELGVLFEIQIQLLNLFIVEVDEIDVETHHPLQTVAFKAIGDPDSVGVVADRLFERWQVLLMVDQLHVSDRSSSATNNRAASSQQIARVSQFGRIDVRSWKMAASQQQGELFRIDAVGFGFASVNGFEIQCVAEQEWQFLGGAKIGEPEPVEGGFAADDEVVFAERCQGEKKRLEVFGVKVFVEWLLASLINDADVH